MGMKKAGLFSKTGCNWWVTPGSNPPSMEKTAQAICKNETCFVRKKPVNPWYHYKKMIPDLFGSGIMCLHYKKDRGVHSPTVEENTKKRSLSLKLKLMVIDSTECTSSTFRSKD